MTDLSALALTCSLTRSPATSSSDRLARQLLDELEQHGVRTSSVRVVDHDVKPGVAVDMGAGDAWPALYEKVLAADILVLSSPIWLGHPSSIAQRVLERLNGDSETDEGGRPRVFDKVALIGVVGNEDGAHKVTADLGQGLNDVGFTLPAQGATYWVGEAMGSTDYQDLEEVPEAVASATATAARNAAHLARLLRGSAYPPVG